MLSFSIRPGIEKTMNISCFPHKQWQNVIFLPPPPFFFIEHICSLPVSCASTMRSDFFYHRLLISPSCSWHPLPVPLRNLGLLFGDLLAFTGVNGMTIVWNLKSFLEMGTKNSNKESSLCLAIPFTF